MHKRLLIGLGLLAPFSLPAMAADAGFGVQSPGVAAQPVWGDLSLAAGFENLVDHQNTSESESGYLVRGEGRFGAHITPSTMFQIDFGLDRDQQTFDAAAVWDFAGHLTMTSGSNAFGIMASVGESQDNPMWTTIAAEGMLGLGSSARLVAQAGWSGDNENNSAPYVHGVLQFKLRPNLMASLNLGYVAPSSDEGPESVWRYGAKMEMAFNSTTSGFVEWQGIHRIEADSPSDITDNNRIMVGLTFHLNNGGDPFSASPFHDFNWKTGVNNQFEY